MSTPANTPEGREIVVAAVPRSSGAPAEIRMPRAQADKRGLAILRVAQPPTPGPVPHFPAAAPDDDDDAADTKARRKANTGDKARRVAGNK